MQWIDRLNDALTYIETHLAEEIDISKAASLACCSTYHFQRMFAYLADVPLSAYIRMRRMSLAAVDLQQSDDKIIDIAMKYGYGSPTAFNRAFQAFHGIAPSAAKKQGAPVKFMSPISFKITIKGVTEMEYRIESYGAIRIVGVSAPLAQNITENFEEVPKLWSKAAMEGTIGIIASQMNAMPMGILGVSACNTEEDWKYYIAAATDKPCPDGLEEYTIPASDWAIFPGSGQCPAAIQDLEKRIFTDWLPTSGYEYGNAADIEVYLSENSQDAKFEVWLPVVKK